MRRTIVIAALALAFAAAAASAWAHAHLQRSVPAAGSTLAAAPSEIRLWFTQDIEPGLSGIEVLNSAGKRVDKNDAGLGDDRKQLKIALGTIEPGAYQVRWHAVSVDTHRTEGDFGFTVKP